MGRGLYPDQWETDAYHIDYDALYQQGFRGIIWDIDNTLMLPDAPANTRAKDLFRKLRAIGFKTVILSNNTGERAKEFARAVRSECVTGALKPLPGGYRRAMEAIGTDQKTTLLIGDQIYTDILGGNLAGIHTILTLPFTDKEEPQIVVKRVLERPVLYFYQKKHKKPGKR